LYLATNTTRNNMKKLTCTALILSSTVFAQNNRINSGSISVQFKEDVKDSSICKIQQVRAKLSKAGYSEELMNDLFGDENFYFPTTAECLETTLYIVDLLIDNDQYEEVNKPLLQSLAHEAYETYNAQTSQTTKLNE